MIDAQWILHIFEATHLEAQANRVKMTPSVDPWGYATMGWVKKRMTEKYQAMKANGNMIATDNKIKSRAVCTARLIQRGLLKEETSGDCDYNFPLATATLMAAISNIVGHKLTDVRRGNITSYFEDVKRRSVEDCSAKRPDLTFY
jgi:hypothetical protein